MILTVGHSTRTARELVSLLGGVELVADVRSFPGSRRYPHFGREAMRIWLPRIAGIEYAHHPGLGGRRRQARGSPNDGWRVSAFRAYADHMFTDEFQLAIEELEEQARGRVTAVMCSEAVWWRCHRRLLADALTVRGWEVLHVMDSGRYRHELTDFAVVEGLAVTYVRPDA